MILLTLTDAPEATTPMEVAEVFPCLVAQLDRATLNRVLTVVRTALVAQASDADELAEWEDDGPA